MDLKKFYPSRPRSSRKGDFGRIVVAGGSNEYSGCLAFNGLAALKAGADLAIIVAPNRAADIAACYSPDLITVPCNTPFPDPKLVRDRLSRADALIIGGGVVRTPQSHTALLKIIGDCSKPIIADAEALHAIASHPSACRGKQVLLTPNAGEYKVLAGQTWPETATDKTRAVKALARRYTASVIVKGADDYISDGTHVYVDHEGSPYMTKGGYGDLVAGVAGAVVARGYSPFEAGKVAAYIVGRAGSMASKKFGESTLASDTLDEIPFAIRRNKN